jgi:predicted amidophosphoribosyltransferase
MRNVKNTMVDRVLALVAPHPCFNCGAVGQPLCDNCKSHITMTQKLTCVFCGASARNGICPDHDLPYSALWIGGLRRGSLQLLVGSFKFRFMRAALHGLTDILAAAIPRLPKDTIVVSVPTLSKHIRQRGYDHALLLAEALAYRRKLKMLRLVERSGKSVQHRLRRAQRFEATSKAFFVPLALDSTVPYLIVDDVLTTGATVGAVADALRAAGAQVIWVAVVAYQPLD